MIKGEYSVDGTLISSLKPYSNKKVVKICDSCAAEKEVSYSTYTNYLREGNSYCQPCAQKVYLSGGNNPAKRPEVRKKISGALKGVKRPENSGRNHHRRKSASKAIIDTRGYTILNDIDKGQSMMHRSVAEKKYGVPLKKGQVVHHIDGDKRNNSESNLFLCHSNSEHSSIHSQLESLALDLVKTGAIKFNEQKGEYYLSTELEISSMPQSLEFNDINIVQVYSDINSRNDVSTKSEVIKGIVLDVPLMCSNMSTVVNPEFCMQINKSGGLGVMHRAYKNNDDYVSDVKKVAAECQHVAASIGVKGTQFELCKNLVTAGANIIFIDVAHGYADYVMQLGRKIKKTMPHVKLVLGNTTNVEMLFETYDFVDALKVGIGGGLACTTKNTAGCYEGQFSSVLKFKEHSKTYGIPIISDGGIRQPTDFTKAISAGASSVMAGSIFARCPESAAELVKGKKIYAGMASTYVQDRWKGGLKEGTCAEGRVVELELGQPLEELLKRYNGALKSGITYAGAKDVKGFQDKVKFVKV